MTDFENFFTLVALLEEFSLKRDHQTQASECSEQENCGENDRQTIKYCKYLSDLTFLHPP